MIIITILQMKLNIEFSSSIFQICFVSLGMGETDWPSFTICDLWKR